MGFAPSGSLRLQSTAKGDFVVRAGGGIFYDLPSATVGNLANGFPNNAGSFFFSVPVPLIDADGVLPAISLQPPFPYQPRASTPHLKLRAPISGTWPWRSHLPGSRPSLVEPRRRSREGSAPPGGPKRAQSGLLRCVSVDTQQRSLELPFFLQLQYRKPLSSRLQASFQLCLVALSGQRVQRCCAGDLRHGYLAQRDYASSDFDCSPSPSWCYMLTLPAAGRNAFGKSL